jgi:hypothetical protein
MTRFTPSVRELRLRAALFWPAELIAREASASIIPALLATQDKFISLLDVADKSPFAWKDALRATSELPANVFLKHLMVLADVGGEPLKRLHPELQRLFPSRVMTFLWREARFEYTFKAALMSKSLDNKSLYVDGKGLLAGHELNDKMEDVAMLLLHSASAVNATLPEILKEKCVIGSLLGRKEELEKFVKQRYILVSKITGGATSNALGQFAQDYVRDVLTQALPNWQIVRNGTIPGISQNAGKTDMNFDLVARSPQGRYIAVEVSFQVTTNSVIERKAGQAQARANLLHQAGHHIAYVLDGAGNFERAAALDTICQYSDCTVTLTAADLAILIEFLHSVG